MSAPTERVAMRATQTIRQWSAADKVHAEGNGSYANPVPQCGPLTENRNSKECGHHRTERTERGATRRSEEGDGVSVQYQRNNSGEDALNHRLHCDIAWPRLPGTKMAKTGTFERERSMGKRMGRRSRPRSHGGSISSRIRRKPPLRRLTTGPTRRGRPIRPHTSLSPPSTRNHLQ